MLNRKSSKKDEGEMLLGNALSKAMKDVPCMEACPSEEEIAELIDQRLVGKKRDAIMSHLSQCPKCYRIFSMGSELVRSEETKGQWKQRRFIPYTIAAGIFLAATALYLTQNLPFFQEEPGQQMVLFARMDLDQGLNDFLSGIEEDSVKDKKAIKEITKLLRDRGYRIEATEIEEIIIEREESPLKGLQLMQQQVEVELRDHVLELKIVK